MNNELALTLSPQRSISPATWKMIEDMAPVIYKSRLFMKSATSGEAAAAIMMKAYELGMPLTAGFDLIQFIEGKLELSPRGALALLHNSMQIAKIEIRRIVESGKYVGHECYMKRNNGFEHTSRWTLADAAKAGLLKPGSGWEKYPENMCLWRAIGFCADVAAPDITAGMTGLMKMPEAYGVALDEAGNVIDGTVSTAPSEPPTADEPQYFGPRPDAPAPVTLNQLLAQYSPDAIMAANGGAIPGTDEQLVTVAAKLSRGGQ